MHIYFSAIFPDVGIDCAAQFPARVCHGPIRSTRRGVSALVLVYCCVLVFFVQCVYHCIDGVHRSFYKTALIACLFLVPSQRSPLVPRRRPSLVSLDSPRQHPPRRRSFIASGVEVLLSSPSNRPRVHRSRDGVLRPSLSSSTSDGRPGVHHLRGGVIRPSLSSSSPSDGRPLSLLHACKTAYIACLVVAAIRDGVHRSSLFVVLQDLRVEDLACLYVRVRRFLGRYHTIS